MDGRESLLRSLRFPDHGYSAGLERQAAFLSALLHPAGITHPARVLPAADSPAFAAKLVGGVCWPELRLPGEHDQLLWCRLRLRPTVVAGRGGTFLYSVANGGAQFDCPETYAGLGLAGRVDSSFTCDFLRAWSSRRFGLVYVVRR